MYDLMQPKWNKLCTGYFTFPGLVYSYLENVMYSTNSHCYFTILKHRKKEKRALSNYLPALLGIHRHPKQKEFLNLLGILEGRTNRSKPTRPLLKNCQNGTF